MTKTFNIFKEKGATGHGTPVDTTDYRTIALAVAGGGSTALTVKFKGSLQADVDFSSARSETNRWDYVQLVDMQDGSTVNGDTGVAFAGSADVRQFLVNTEGIIRLGAEITAFTAGTLTVDANVYNLRGIC